MSLNLSLNIEWHLLTSYCLFRQERQKREAGFLEFRLNPVKQFCTAHLRSLTQIYGDNSDRKSNLTYKEQSNTDRVKFWRHIIIDRVNLDTTVAIMATNYILIVPNSGHWSWQITATNNILIVPTSGHEFLLSVQIWHDCADPAQPEPDRGNYSYESWQFIGATVWSHKNSPEWSFAEVDLFIYNNDYCLDRCD